MPFLSFATACVLSSFVPLVDVPQINPFEVCSRAREKKGKKIERYLTQPFAMSVHTAFIATPKISPYLLIYLSFKIRYLQRH